MTTQISAANIESGTLVSFSGPKVSSIGYIGDDTAANIAGGQTITLNGSGFTAGATVLINGTPAPVVTFVNGTQLSFTSPAMSTGGYVIYVINPDGGTAISIPGIQYSGVPAWSTAAGILGTVYETAAISSSLTATSDSIVSYSVTSGIIPATTALNASTGLLSGPAPAVTLATTYNFTVTATDGENQDTARNFSYTVTPDLVTWSTPADGAILSGASGTAFTQALSATSAAGKAITYTANVLPSGISISGASITGTPSTASSISSLITATAATTGKTATRTINWGISASRIPTSIEYLVVGPGGNGGGNTYPNSNNSGGGGGSGGAVYGTDNLGSSTTSLTITVGISSGTSSIVGTNFTRTAYRGGDGAAPTGNAGQPGGTGNGGQGGAQGDGQTSIGGNGGAGGNYYSPGAGGGGTYSGGGGGGGSGGGYSGPGYGSGGAGGNRTWSGTNFDNIGTNWGAGGGGGTSTSGTQGIVAIKYLSTVPAPSQVTGTYTTSTVNGYRVYKFTSSGTITF